jgi:hypothetical protein
MMKRLIAIYCALAIFVGGLFTMTAPVLAFDPFGRACASDQAKASPACQRDPTADPISGATGDGILIKAANLLSEVVGVAAVIIIIIGGIMYVLSTGDSARVNSAKNTILYALVGLAIAALAQAIIRFVLVQLK